MGNKNSKKSHIIAIAGPSGSGKSEVCNALQKEFKDMLRVSIDNYFRGPEDLPRIGSWVNSDVPEAIRFDLLAKDLTILKRGDTVTASIFKYPHKNWERTTTILRPARLIIIDGFLVLYDREVRRMCDFKIFIDVSEKLQFQRRMNRDKEWDEGYIRQVVIPNYKNMVFRQSNMPML